MNDYLDELDRLILDVVQGDGRISNAELAKRINLSPPATHARLRRLEEQGYIQHYAALLNREQLGYDLLCFISVRLQLHQLEQVMHFRAVVQEMPEVLECHHVTGEYDYLLKVVVSSRKALEHFLMKRLTPVAGIAHIHTSMVLSEVKNTTRLPLGG